MAFDKFKARKEVVKQRMADNKVFVVAVAIILLFLVVQAIKNKDAPDAAEFRYPEGYNEQQESSTDEATAEEKQKQPEEPHWRFYWSDLVILGVGSAVCGTMIIKERRKARENL